MKTHLILTLTLTAGFAIRPLLAAPAPPAGVQQAAVLAAREQRANLILDELKALDTRIESRTDVIVDALRTIGDSKDSRTKVARMKEQTIDALKKNIGYYQTKRAALQEELRRPTLRLTEEQKRKGVGAFDARIEKRVGQILAVQKSLPASQDYERYKVSGSDWNGPTYAVNEDFRQNQRVSSHTTAQRKEVEDGLRRSIARIEQQNRTLKAQNGPAEEIAKNAALLADRRKQLASSRAPSGTQTRGLGQKEAADLDKALQGSIAELRKDFTTLFALYSAYVQELSAVNQTRGTLSAERPKAS